MIKNKRGSSLILLSMIFTSFALCVVSSISISRKLAVRSESEAFGRVWTQAILSEYDVHLLKDYGIMAYWGLDSDVKQTLMHYYDYSMKGKLRTESVGIDVNLMGFELSNPDNFRKSVKNSGLVSLADSVVKDSKRVVVDNAEASDDTRWGSRVIRNNAVTSSLPSKGIKNSFDVDSIKDRIKNISSIDAITESFGDCAMDLAFMYKYLGSHNETIDGKKTLFRNEWEYVITGSLNDSGNYKAARNKIRLIRNSLNLLFLMQNSEKRDVIMTAAELITPGPAATATALLISEAWALVETDYDMKTLEAHGRVPVLKTSATWKTDLVNALKSDKLNEGLDEEGRKLLSESMGGLSDTGKGNSSDDMKDGLSYEDYLLILAASLDSNVRTLRIMDIVTVNMKYRYYDDFNMDEYHTGIEYSMNIDGREYDFKDCYS